MLSVISVQWGFFNLHVCYSVSEVSSKLYKTLLWPPRTLWEETDFFNITMKWKIVTNHSCDILAVLLCFRPPIFIFTYISSLSLTNLITVVLEEEAIRFASHDLFFSLTDRHRVDQLFPSDSHVSSYIFFIILASVNLSNKRMFPSTIFLLPWKLSYKLISTLLILWYLFIRFNQYLEINHALSFSFSLLNKKNGQSAKSILIPTVISDIKMKYSCAQVDTLT